MVVLNGEDEEPRPTSSRRMSRAVMVALKAENFPLSAARPLLVEYE